MGEQDIGNPQGAFNPLTDPSAAPGKPEQTTKVVYNSGASAKINVNEWVQLDVAGSAGHVLGAIRGVHGGNFGAVLGIALDTIPAGGYGRVVTEGPAQAIAGSAAIVAGQQVSPSSNSTSDGQVISTAFGSVTAAMIGSVIGLAQQAQATQAGLFWMWVRPS